MRLPPISISSSNAYTALASTVARIAGKVGKPRFNVVSLKFSRNRSAASTNPARKRSGFTPAAAAITSSSDPYSANHFAAVFGPTPVNPGILSDVSPYER